MSDSVEAAQAALDAHSYQEGGFETMALIERRLAVEAARMTTTAATEAAKYRTVGDYRVAQPVPELTLPAPPEIAFDLPAEFAGHESAIAHAQNVAEHEGFDQLPSILMMLAHTPSHELTPPGIDAEGRTRMADAAQASIRVRHGDERGQEIIDAAVAGVRALGLQGVARGLRQENHPAIIEALGQAWLVRRAAR
jgi:hypothetical protein